jgi:tocopherol cyclase
MFQQLRATWNPDMYHGWGRSSNYFEGWYFKIVSADERHALAFIPGISMGQNGEQHAFIQVMDGVRHRASYHRFPSGAFRPSERGFELNIGDNYFSSHSMRLNLPDFQGELQFHMPQPWPKMLGAPGIMGWYSFVPFMECNHGIVSLHHQISGALTTPQGDTVNFEKGIGYIEKDWGSSFPRAYVWMQSNHFDTTDRACLMASVAHIPWLRSHFVGFISGCWIEDRLYRFATYTGAKKHLQISADDVQLVFKSPKTELRIHARQAPGVTLVSPLSGEMTGKINESLQATLEVELLERGQRIFSGKARNAGLEVAGMTDLIVG